MGQELKSFEDLDVWQTARRIVNEVYAMSRDSHLCQDFGLCSQLQRAVVSIMSNIAVARQPTLGRRFRGAFHAALVRAGSGCLRPARRDGTCLCLPFFG